MKILDLIVKDEAERKEKEIERMREEIKRMREENHEELNRLVNFIEKHKNDIDFRVDKKRLAEYEEDNSKYFGIYVRYKEKVMYGLIFKKTAMLRDYDYFHFNLTCINEDGSDEYLLYEEDDEKLFNLLEKYTEVG